MFRNYSEDGPALLTDPESKIRGHFVLENTTSTIANTLRRCILTHTRSVGFRADLTNDKDPGVKVRKNTGIIFNEMLAHRITLIPVGVRDIDNFDPSRYECVLRVRNDTTGPVHGDTLRHVKASDFVIREQQTDGVFADLGPEATAAMFPADPITKDTTLITTLRPQWNSEQPAEEIDLTAYPIIGTGQTFIGFSPVSQCSYGNTLDEDPVRQDRFFVEWLTDYKKIVDPTSVEKAIIDNYRKEWETMAIQRCYRIDPATGEANSFTFTVESVGIRPVPDIVAEGIRAVIALVTPYTDASTPLSDLGMTIQPTNNRMEHSVDVLFADQEHTLGNLLQTMATELYLDTQAGQNAPLDSPITFAGYKIRHPLHKVATLTLGFREGLGDNNALARQVVATAAQRARDIFEKLAAAWSAVSGVGEDADAGVTLEG